MNTGTTTTNTQETERPGRGARGPAPTVLGLLLAVAAVSAFGGTEGTVEDLMSVPYASNLVASPDGGKLAWSFSHQGRPSVWLAEPPDHQARALVRFGEDDGRPIADLDFAPDGEFLVFTFGSDVNPTSDPEGAEPAIYRTDTDTGETRRLATGSGPAISPDGGTVVFAEGGTVYRLPADGSEAAETLFTARGSQHGLSWSPDGSRLLFTSSRGSHSFVGVYERGAETITWLDPDVYRDRHAVWSPEGGRVAFLRLPPRKHREAALSRHAGIPFSLRVYDLEEEAGREVWRSDTGGGFAQSYPDAPLQWAAGDRLVFFSEHDGWMNLYAVDAAGGEPAVLIGGEFDVERAALSPDRHTLLVSSNEGDIDRRHLWTVPVTGGERERVAGGRAVHWSPVFLSGGEQVAFFRSTAQMPGLPWLAGAGGEEARPLAEDAVPERFPADRLVEPEVVVFEADDGTVLRGQLFEPPGEAGRDARSALVYVHGGPRQQMYPAWHDGRGYHWNYAVNQALALSGHVVLVVNFRGGIGRGRDFRTMPDRGPRGAAEYTDVLAAWDFLAQRRDVDPDRIGLWGPSYGGYLAALGLARDSERFAAGVNIHGLHDWAMRAERHDGAGRGIHSEEELAVARASSPVADVDQWTSPVLFVHSDDDRNVEFLQATDLVRRLKDRGQAHVETLVFPDEAHGLLLFSNFVTAVEATVDFFERFLEPKPSEAD